MRPPTLHGIVREWIHRVWGGLRRNRSDGDLEREMQAHLELAEEELRRRGHTEREAARLARVRFGLPSQAMEPVRVQRGLPWLDMFSLDVKLGLRMMHKYWELTEASR